MIPWGIPVSLTLGIVYYTYALQPMFGLSRVSTFFRSTAIYIYIGGYLLFFLFIAVFALIAGLTIGILKAAGG